MQVNFRKKMNMYDILAQNVNPFRGKIVRVYLLSKAHQTITIFIKAKLNYI